MALQRDRMALWLGWIMLSSAVFTFVPLGPYGLIGWVGAAGPLLPGIVPALRGWRTLAVGAAVMVLAFLLADAAQWFELAGPYASLLIGVWLTPALRNSAAGLAAASGADDRGAQQEFDRALIRELGRARRYVRPLTMISASVDDQKDLRLLREAIGAQIHIYCQLAVVDGRLLVIVPELGAEACIALEQRIIKSIREFDIASISLGMAGFPRDAVSAAGLVRSADANRRPIGTGEITGTAAAAQTVVDNPASLGSRRSAP